MTAAVLDRDVDLAERDWQQQALARVEKQLMRPSRKDRDGRFHYPTRFDIGGGHTAKERQQLGISMLLLMACEVAENPQPIMLRRDMEATRAMLLATAKKLREMAAQFVQLGLRKPHCISSEEEFHHIDPWIVAAEEARDEVAILDARTIVVERGYGDLRQQAVAIEIANACRMLFGASMPGIVADLMWALTGERLEPHRVRDWIAARRGRAKKLHHDATLKSRVTA